MIKSMLVGHSFWHTNAHLAKAKSTTRIPKWQVQWYTAAVSQINKKTMNKSVRLEGLMASKNNKTGIVAFVMEAATSMCQKVGSDNSKISGSLLRFSAQNPRLYTALFGCFGPF